MAEIGFRDPLDLNDRLAQSLGDDSGQLLVNALIEQVPDFLFVKDTDGKFVVANQAIAKAYGLQPHELIGKTDYDLHRHALAQQFFECEQQVIRTGVALLNMEETFQNSDGLRRYYSTTKVPLRNRDGVTVGLIGVARDITSRKQIESFNQQQNMILEEIAMNAPLGTVLNHLVILIESQMSHVSGSVLLYDAEAGVLRHGAAPNISEAYSSVIDGIVVGPNVGSCGTAVFRRETVKVADIRIDPLWADYRDLAERFQLRSCWSTPILSHEGQVLGTFAIYAHEVRTPTDGDIGLIKIATRIAGIAIERHRAEAQLVHMAHYDALTTLPNRVLCLRRLTTALGERRVKKTHVAMLFIDLDGFKHVNDLLGHQVGDELLRAVGARLRHVVPPDHLAARLGGDEFAVIQVLHGDDHRRDCARLGTKIVAALSQPFDIRDHHIVVGASVGIAIAPEDDDDTESLLRDADLALYRAKADERGSVRFFEPEMNLRAQRRRILESDMRRALDAGEFEVFYQPLVDLASNAVCACEALVRWNHPQRGRVAPDEFISVAEEIGLIVPIGEWVLRQACAEAAQWPETVKIAVNISPVQFRQQSLLGAVTSALEASGLSPLRLELEITESVVLLDGEANLAMLHQLRKLGIQISLDDFGTGYSSLSYLRSFPFNKIKIDRSFVRDLETNPDCLAIVRAVTRLASDLGMRTTAEGVETAQQREQLLGEGCDEGQGFLFSRPVPALEALALIERRILA